MSLRSLYAVNIQSHLSGRLHSCGSNVMPLIYCNVANVDIPMQWLTIGNRATDTEMHSPISPRNAEIIGVSWNLSINQASVLPPLPLSTYASIFRPKPKRDGEIVLHGPWIYINVA